MEEHAWEEGRALQCGHRFSSGVWRDNFAALAGDATACVDARCMYGDCRERVRPSLVDELGPPGDAAAFREARLRCQDHGHKISFVAAIYLSILAIVHWQEQRNPCSLCRYLLDS